MNRYKKQGGGLGLIDLGAGTQSLLAQLDELNGVGVGTGAPGPLAGGEEDLFVVAAADASAFGGASTSRGAEGGGGGGGRSAAAAAAAAARMLGSGAVARFRGFDADGGGELPLLGGAGGRGSQQQQQQGEDGAGAAAVAGDRLPAVPDDLMNELDYYNQGMEGFGGGGDGMMQMDGGGGGGGGEEQKQQHRFPEEEVVGGARLAPGSAPKLRRVARPAVDPEAAGLLPSAVIRSWIQDASPTLVPGGRGGAVAAASSSSSSSAAAFESLPSSSKRKKTAAAAAAACLRVDELRRRLAPQGPFAVASASSPFGKQPLGPWPAPLQAMLLSRMTVPGVADEPPPAARGRSRKRGRAGDAAGAAVLPQSPGAAANAPFDAFAEANAGGENVHDFGFGEFGAGGEMEQGQQQQMQDEFGGV